MLKKKIIRMVFTLSLLCFQTYLLNADTLWTVKGKKYNGKIVAFKYNLIYFNIFRFGEYAGEQRFPLNQIWKIEFNKPELRTSSKNMETEKYYKKLRANKRSTKIKLMANTKWLDTGIQVKKNQILLFNVLGSINITKEEKVFAAGQKKLKLNKNKTLFAFPIGIVIGKIGEKGHPFYIGDDKAPKKINEEGKLYIGINDFNFEDNSNFFDVYIYY